jgi:hypothetical protein
MLNNINRWRGQMQLAPLAEQQLAATIRQIKSGDATLTLVDLHGHFQGGGMAAPFAGATSPAGATTPGASAELPAGHPPIAPTDAAATSPAAPAGETPTSATSKLPTFSAPASWQPGPGGEFSRATFLISDGPQMARVTVSEFAANAGPMITDPLANVNRWRRDIGLPPVDKDSIEQVTRPILVDGQAATYMPGIPAADQPSESQSKLATLAAMVPVGDRVWFFKLTGDRNVVIAEQERFRAFLDSVRFTAGRGATDGN